MSVCNIASNDRTLIIPIYILSWTESQTSNPAIRDVPNGNDGQYIDTGTYVIECRKINFTCRFTNLYKDNFNIIFDECKLITFSLSEPNALDGWSYTCWIRSKKIKWEYKQLDVADTNNDKEYVWLADIEMDVSYFSYNSGA